MLSALWSRCVKGLVQPVCWMWASVVKPAGLNLTRWQTSPFMPPFYSPSTTTSPSPIHTLKPHFTDQNCYFTHNPQPLSLLKLSFKFLYISNGFGIVDKYMSDDNGRVVWSMG